ncbi:DUF2268 domain-containing protein [Streptomyces sp. Je 1-4]|uniref:DUF2268 domain-containing protein n=1 Tax=Streptomyces TaxID=1883 RepID=UPI0021DA46F4|nr:MULTISPECIES: DUF2268 domain-containing protein [unclassified Streptomyces]UYB37881.1 DUF2268 domain-containing protein [Streptomyces sp. Je 1-4]UZQ33808.1 DUF2268 domain-containing protein [Streptomyces sp. Je 1-4] [Streptomyces sp. Je 1-4 4N24]UZQ41226.1 DUF2268 domain-containing protein [Streptomyces sp. Je 1-4] [Streptomyces sp. Je 1-4 4N24_ara]
MKIVVHDTASAMLDLLQRPLEERPDALREMLSPLQSAMSIAGDMDLVQIHQQGSGFRLDREDPRYVPALRQMQDAGVWDRVEDSLTAAWERISDAAPGIEHADTVHVVLVLGDPDDEHLRVRSAGYFGMGGFPGAIHLAMWPTDTSLEKIGYCAAHELHHNVRYANVVWNPMTVTLGEYVVAEGLAEAFVRELAGEQAMGPWSQAVTGAALDSAYERITADIDVAGMQNLTAYVLGDATAQLLGQQPVGLPDFAGYAAGLRIVDAHLAASGLTAAQSTALSAREVLINAGVQTSA